ncbi:MAG: glycosyltransferase family 39 protein [Lentisphaerota bacterium]
MGRRKPQGKNNPLPAPAPVKGEPVARIFWALFLAALVIRLIALGRSDLWCDEILFVQLSSPPMSPWDVMVNQWNKFVVVTHFPLPEVVHDVFLWLVGLVMEEGARHSFIQRLPAVIWGSFAVPMVYLLGRRMGPAAIAVAAALMMCFFFYPVYYAREAYYYAPLVFFTASLLYLLFSAMERGGMSGRRKLLYVLCGTGMVYSHLTGSAFLLVILSVLAATLLGGRLLRRAPAPAILKSLTLLLLLPVLAVSPFFIKLFVQRSGMQYFVPGLPMPFILNDIIAKAFIGKLLIPNVLAWLVFAAGALALMLRSEKSLARRMLAAMVLVTLTVLAFSAHKSQYNERYFAVLMPAFYLVFAAGVGALVGWPARMLKLGERQERLVFGAAAGFTMLIHIALFLPALYAIQAKAVDYGGIARWLNANMRPGTPYCFDTGGWDLRFVPGYFPTPQLTPAVWIAWNGPDYDPNKQRIQRDMMERFPESAYIEGYVVDWDVPRRSYKRSYELNKGPVDRLRRFGIWIDNDPPGKDQTFRAILYNTREDAIQIAREKNKPVFFDLAQFRCAQIAQEVYAYVGQGPSAQIGVMNLRGQPVRGALVLRGGLMGGASSYSMSLTLGNRTLVQTNQPSGMLWNLETPVVEIPADGQVLRWSAAPGLSGDAQALIVEDIRLKVEGEQASDIR